MNTFGFSHSFMASFRTWDIRIINFTKTCNFKLWQINQKHCSRNPSATILHANFEKTRGIPHPFPGCCVGNYKRVEPGFDPGTSCTQSRNHTSRPHDRCDLVSNAPLLQDLCCLYLLPISTRPRSRSTLRTKLDHANAAEWRVILQLSEHFPRKSM